MNIIAKVSIISDYSPINEVGKHLFQYKEFTQLQDKIIDLVLSIMDGYTMFTIRAESTRGILMALTPFQAAAGFGVITFIAQAAVSGHRYFSTPYYWKSACTRDLLTSSTDIEEETPSFLEDMDLKEKSILKKEAIKIDEISINASHQDLTTDSVIWGMHGGMYFGTPGVLAAVALRVLLGIACQVYCPEFERKTLDSAAIQDLSAARCQRLREKVQLIDNELQRESNPTTRRPLEVAKAFFANNEKKLRSLT